MVRSISITGGLVAAALAVVIGLAASHVLHQHSGHTPAPGGGGSSQAGSHGHGGGDLLTELLGTRLAGLISTPAAHPAPRQPAPPVSVSSFGGTGSGGGSSSGGSSSGGSGSGHGPAQSAVVTTTVCAPGLLDTVVAVLGSVLGSSTGC